MVVWAAGEAIDRNQRREKEEMKHHVKCRLKMMQFIFQLIL